MIFTGNENRTKIEEVKEIYDRWRIEKPGRRAVPLAMRQMVVGLIGEYSLTRICRELNLTMSNVKKWKVRLAEDQAFFESSGGSTEIISQPQAPLPAIDVTEKKPVSAEVTFLELGNIVGSSSQTRQLKSWKKIESQVLRSAAP
jgi:hypothetical protein